MLDQLQDIERVLRIILVCPHENTACLDQPGQQPAAGVGFVENHDGSGGGLQLFAHDRKRGAHGGKRVRHHGKARLTKA